MDPIESKLVQYQRRVTTCSEKEERGKWDEDEIEGNEGGNEETDYDDYDKEEESVGRTMIVKRR